MASLVNINPGISTNGLIGVLDPGSTRHYISGSNFAYARPSSITASISNTVGYDTTSNSFEFIKGTTPEPYIELPQHILAYNSSLHDEDTTNLVNYYNIVLNPGDGHIFAWPNGSLGFWIKISSETTNEVYIYDSTTGTDRSSGYKSIYYNPGIGITFELAGPNTTPFNLTIDPNDFSLDEFFYITFTWQEGSTSGANDALITGYINGEPKGTSTGVYFTNTGANFNLEFNQFTNIFFLNLPDASNTAYTIYTSPIYIGNKIPI